MKKNEKVKINLNYGNEVFSLPMHTIDFVDRAKKFDIKVLMLISSSMLYRREDCIERIASELKCGQGEVAASVAFWNGTGVLTLNEGEEKAENATSKKFESVEEQKSTTSDAPKRIKNGDLPQYTTEELNLLLEKHNGVGRFIDECQNVLGKIFNTSDVKIIMGLIDHLGLDEEYILVLMHHCAQIEKKSMRYIERTAVDCLDEGIEDAHILEGILRSREDAKKAQNKIRNIFGISNRALTTKEKKLIELWTGTYAFDTEIITKAYEITVDTINEPSMPYTGAILEKWHSEGLKSIDEINDYVKKSKEEKNGKSNFDVDDFFDAALKRSYSDK